MLTKDRIVFVLAVTILISGCILGNQEQPVNTAQGVKATVPTTVKATTTTLPETQGDNLDLVDIANVNDTPNDLSSQVDIAVLEIGQPGGILALNATMTGGGNL